MNRITRRFRLTDMAQRLRWLAGGAVLAGMIAALPASAVAQDPDIPLPARPQPEPQPDAQPATDDEFATDVDRFVTPRGRRAVAEALKFLVGQQNNDGSFGRHGAQNFSIAITSLAGLALVAGGNLPGRGPYGENVLKTIQYLLSCQSDTGYFTTAEDRSRTHGHGFATLFLAQVLGMVANEDLHQRLKSSLASAVTIIERAQTEEGGWGYVPDDRTWDEGSTTVTLVQGLRAARDAGIRVDRRVIDNAIRYVHRSAIRVDWRDTDGNSHVGYTFRYSLRYNNTRSTFPLTAAAVSSLQGSGRYEGEVLEGGMRWLDGFYNETMQSRPNMQWYERFYFYSHFYAAQAFYHAPDPRLWQNYYPKIRNELIGKQNSRNGSWSSSYGEVYGTAIAALILQIPDGFLPIFQK